MSSRWIVVEIKEGVRSRDVTAVAKRISTYACVARVCSMEEHCAPTVSHSRTDDLSKDVPDSLLPIYKGVMEHSQEDATSIADDPVSTVFTQDEECEPSIPVIGGHALIYETTSLSLESLQSNPHQIVPETSTDKSTPTSISGLCDELADRSPLVSGGCTEEDGQMLLRCADELFPEDFLDDNTRTHLEKPVSDFPLIHNMMVAAFVKKEEMDVSDNFCGLDAMVSSQSESIGDVKSDHVNDLNDDPGMNGCQTSTNGISNILGNDVVDVIVCQLCHVAIRKKTSIRGHLHIHMKKRYSCPVNCCPFTNIRKLSVKRHISSKHSVSDCVKYGLEPRDLWDFTDPTFLAEIKEVSEICFPAYANEGLSLYNQSSPHRTKPRRGQKNP